jgi:hypothetical protein
MVCDPPKDSEPSGGRAVVMGLPKELVSQVLTNKEIEQLIEESTLKFPSEKTVITKLQSQEKLTVQKRVALMNATNTN